MDTLQRTEAQVAADEIWPKMDNDQKTAVRIGMFPVEIMRKYEHIPGKDLAVALMDKAKHDGGIGRRGIYVPHLS